MASDHYEPGGRPTHTPANGYRAVPARPRASAPQTKRNGHTLPQGYQTTPINVPTPGPPPGQAPPIEPSMRPPSPTDFTGPGAPGLGMGGPVGPDATMADTSMLPPGVQSVPHQGSAPADSGEHDEVGLEWTTHDPERAAASGRGSVLGRRPMSGVSLAGFVVSFFVGPVGLVLSLCGLGLTVRGHVRGRGLAIAGTLISMVTSVVFLYGGLQAYRMAEQLVALQNGIGAPGVEVPVGDGTGQAPDPQNPGGPVDLIPESAVRDDADEVAFVSQIQQAQAADLAEIGPADLVGAGVAICVAQAAGRDPQADLPEMLGVSAESAQLVFDAAQQHLCTPVGPQDGQQPGGQQPPGDQPAGQQPEGQQPEGQQPEGQQPPGDQPADQQPDGQ